MIIVKKVKSSLTYVIEHIGAYSFDEFTNYLSVYCSNDTTSMISD